MARNIGSRVRYTNGVPVGEWRLGIDNFGEGETDRVDSLVVCAQPAIRRFQRQHMLDQIFFPQVFPELPTLAERERGVDQIGVEPAAAAQPGSFDGFFSAARHQKHFQGLG